jgi:hypothetical protein
MPWHYPFGGSDTVTLDKQVCKHFLEREKPTVFDHITQSVEALAPEFVEPYTCWGEDGYLETRWRTNFRELSGMLFDTREEVISATVAELKKEYTNEN